jgi:hypothetical protein
MQSGTSPPPLQLPCIHPGPAFHQLTHEPGFCLFPLNHTPEPPNQEYIHVYVQATLETYRALGQPAY